ncbi:MAG: AAA family ATPase, partial [Candidatus Xenobia bacterium]
PQDCGKRFMARCIAGEINAPLLEVDAHLLTLDHDRNSATARMESFLNSLEPGESAVVLVYHVEALQPLETDRRFSQARIPRLLYFLSPLQRSSHRVMVLFQSDVPWVVHTSLLSSALFRTLLFCNPPDETARMHLFEAAFGHRIPDELKRDTLRNSAGFSTTDIMEAVDLMRGEQEPDEGEPRVLARFLDEDRWYMQNPKWKPDVLLRVLPSTREWFEEAERTKLSRRHVEVSDALRESRGRMRVEV